MTDKLVSVIVPVYNSAAHIEAALTSIINQDYENLEIIIVNDASTDSSRDIAENLLLSCGRKFRIIDHEKNLGVSAARNNGLKIAEGEYVWFCDSDDIAKKNFVSALCGKSQEKNSDVVFCSLTHYYEDNGTFKDEIIKIPDMSSPDEYIEAWAKGKIFLWSIWNFIFRREFLLKHNLQFIEGRMYGEDTEFVMKALILASNISCVKDILYTYVHHNAQTVNKKKQPAMFASLIKSRSKTWRFILRHKGSRHVRNYILSYCFPDMLVERFNECAGNNDTENYNKLMRMLKHKKIRGLLLSSVKFIHRKPELFFKALIIVHAPILYYRLRKGK